MLALEGTIPMVVQTAPGWICGQLQQVGPGPEAASQYWEDSTVKWGESGCRCLNRGM